MSETINQKSVRDMYVQDMVRYSIGVNRRRMIPEIRDGLKPVQRRILYTLHELHMVEPRTIKSNKVIGDTMGNYHPHSSTGIYGAIATIGAWFLAKEPLVHVDGNWGTIMGDGPAADRYTECGLSKFGYENMIAELSETDAVVDWTKNYTETKKEPNYLPVRVPILLINGASGMGLGMSCNIPKHNLVEVINATREIIAAITRGDNPDYVKTTLIPDFCYPCNIIDTDWDEICAKGSGIFKARGTIKVTEYDKCPALVITSLPDGVTTGAVEDKLMKMYEQKQLPMVKDIIDSSGGTEFKLIVQLKPGSDPNYMKEVLYKKTPVETSFSVNTEIVDDMTIGRFSYNQYLQRFIAQRVITKFRYYCAKMQDTKTELHQISTYIKVLDSGDIDFIINKIKKRKTDDDNELIEFLIKKFDFTDLQAKFIINSSLKNLSIARLNKYKAREKELLNAKNYYEIRIMDNNKILEEIDEELVEVAQKYGKPRVCRVIKASDDNNIPKGEFLLVVTENNFLRKISLNDRANPVRGDLPKFILKVENTENVLLFDNKGKVFKLPIFKLPVSEKGNPGIDVRMLIKGLTADIISVTYEPTIKQVAKYKDKHFITIVSENNYIKKLDLDDFLNVPTSGIIYTKLTDDDTVKDICIVPDKLDVIVYSQHKALRIPMRDIPYYKRASQGVFAMNTTDKISGLSVVYPNANYMVVITESGKINKYNISGLECSTRYKAGNKVIKLGKTDSIHSIYGVADENTLRIVTRTNIYNIPVSEIRVNSSISAGEKMIPLKSDTIIRIDVM